MSSEEVEPSWDAKWEAIGPFPSGMREHPLYGSPLHAFPPHSGQDTDVDFARRAYDSSETWPSELATGGRVGWSTFQMEPDGQLDISFPDINWKQLKNDHGWASLQYQVLLRTRFNVPRPPAPRETELIGFKMDFQQCVEYVFVPIKGETGPMEWYQGDIYGFGDTPSGSTNAGRTSNLARSLALAPGEYMLLVRTVYEIRLFGDPADNSPTINLRMRLERDHGEVELLGGLTQVPSVVNGWLVGSWVAVAIRVPATADDVDVSARGETKGLILESTEDTRIRAGQTRMVAMRIRQSEALEGGKTLLTVDLTIKRTNGGTSSTISWSVSLDHKGVDDVFKITFASPCEPRTGAPALVSYAMIVPPHTRADTSSTQLGLPVTLILHGAGNWPENDNFTDNVPKNGSWTVCPMGRTEWGEDWRGGSMSDAWAARRAFGEVMRAKLGLKMSEETLLVGHSNGGQGAWHLAARYPDRIVGLVVAAGYTKTQDYVPYTENVSNHYADPALMGILHASLTPYNNDLHLSNLVHMPILAFHGSVDGNVPPRHGRLQASIVDAWAGKKDHVKMVEVEGEDHWWPGIFNGDYTRDFISHVHIAPWKTWKEKREEGFTLTSGNPDECGGLAGIRITELIVPGRLARLDVNKEARQKGDPDLRLRSTNVKRIEVIPLSGFSGAQTMSLDGRLLDDHRTSADKPTVYELTWNGWRLAESNTSSIAQTRRYGPVLRTLATSHPLVIVPGSSTRHNSIAKRVAHDLFVHHRIDVGVAHPEEAVTRLKNGNFGHGNLLVLGGPTENEFARHAFEKEGYKSPVDLTDPGCIGIQGRQIKDQDTGIIALQPHPTNQDGLMLLVHGNDDLGLELAARLIPLRTGIPIPDWAIVSPRMQWQGAGGLVGAGFWDGQWGWSESMSWIDRIPDTAL